MRPIHAIQQPKLDEQNNKVIALPKPVTADCQIVEARAAHSNLPTLEKLPARPTLDTQMIAHEMQSPLCVILNVLSS